MGLLDILFPKQGNQIKEAFSQGAIIIDVRTAQEYRMGKVDGSINIPLDNVSKSMNKIKKYKKPIVMCCASGSRSAAATGMLRNAGVTNVYNGRSWNRVNRLLSQM